MTAPGVVMRPIGVARTPYTETAQIPRGPGAKHDAEGVLEIRPDLEAGLQDVEGFSHLFVIWVFHRSEGYDLVGIPFVDTQPRGVFATRSPLRPNHIGLSIVELLEVRGNRLTVRGIDILDGTPLLDLKPYVAAFDRVEESRSGWMTSSGEEIGAKRSDGRFS